jgi:hypothetical protein
MKLTRPKAIRTRDLGTDLACKYGGGGAAPRAAMRYAKSPFATGDRDRQRFRPAPVSALGAGPTPYPHQRRAAA